ncbi:hypothetical protein K0651_02925 [Ornithinimicrobium sp. Arc0846-15]|nr:hypothetical protein [Ornithinimicrobium laminariae]
MEPRPHSAARSASGCRSFSRQWLCYHGDVAVPSGPPGSAPPAPEALFDVRIAWAIAIFLLMAAIEHLLTAAVYCRAYEMDLKRGINRFRWIEYSFSATMMILLIAFYNGITAPQHHR